MSVFRVPDIPKTSRLLRFHYWACRQVAVWGTALIFMGFIAEILGSPVAQEWDSRAPMPPASMQAKIVRMIDDGRGPGYILVSQGELRKKCHRAFELWGCTVDLMGMKSVYILKTLHGERKLQAIIHEYAHAEYDWRH